MQTIIFNIPALTLNARSVAPIAKGNDMTLSIQVYCVANQQATLARDLQRSPEIADRRVRVSVVWGASAASAAFHELIGSAKADILVFAHQDVYFPDGWFSQLRVACERLSSIEPAWAVAGVCGMTADSEFVAHLWDSGLATICGGPFDSPVPVVSLDEVVLIVRRASGVSFDPALPSFHLYGTDIVLEARKAGMKSYALDLPVIHNSKANVRLDRAYVAAYRFMVRKWKTLLPLPTVIAPLTPNPLPLLLRRARLRYKAIFRSSTMHPRLESPELKARELGFVKRSHKPRPMPAGSRNFEAASYN
jgi:hypothetical protein